MLLADRRGAVYWDVGRRLVNGPGDAPAKFDLPIVGTFPVKHRRRFDLWHPFRPPHLANRRLADAVESLQMTMLDDRKSHNRVLMVCGADGEEGAAELARELALSLADSDYRTVLVDANLRQPRLHAEFGVPAGCGVSDALCERAEIWDILHDTGKENLWLAPAGGWNKKVHAALMRGNAALLIDTLRSIYQFVVIAGGPVLHGAETRFFSRYADAVLLSVQRDVTRVDRAAEAVEILRSLHINLLGAAVVL